MKMSNYDNYTLQRSDFRFGPTLCLCWKCEFSLEYAEAKDKLIYCKKDRCLRPFDWFCAGGKRADNDPVCGGAFRDIF